MPASKPTRRQLARCPAADPEAAFEVRTDPDAPAGDVLPALAALLIELAEKGGGSAGHEPGEVAPALRVRL